MNLILNSDCFLQIILFAMAFIKRSFIARVTLITTMSIKRVTLEALI